VPGRIAGEAFLGGGVDKLFFTGSVQVGRRLMARAAETLTPVSLELGGNDPMLVCPDADLTSAAEGAVWAGLSSAGQSCGGIERIYVHESVHERFVEILCRRVEALRVGKDEGPFLDMGAMTTREQLETVKAHVEDAVEKGAEIRARSSVPEDTKGTFHPAMVLTGVDHSMRVMKEETFGPVLAVMRVADMDEAVRLANDCDLGLSGSVWSRSHRRARKLASRLSTGTIMVNDHLMNHGLAETPWGGFRNSGIGRTHGRIGFDEMTEPQCIIDDILPLKKRAFWWQPNDATVYHGMRGLIEMLHASSLGARLSGLVRILKLLPRYWTRPRLPERT
jgi:succinate-semialdehyde dehydrogenase/glutarate-semialdehyde dehydrogenase